MSKKKKKISIPQNDPQVDSPTIGSLLFTPADSIVSPTSRSSDDGGFGQQISITAQISGEVNPGKRLQQPIMVKRTTTNLSSGKKK